MSADTEHRVLVALLERYERGALFGRTGPWPRDVIVPFHPATFPAAFAPEGYDVREDLIKAAIDDARRGALRIIPVRGHDHRYPKEFRLGHKELGAAYAAAHDYEPLAPFFGRLQELSSFLSQDTTSWLSSFLRELAAGAKGLDLSRLRIADRTRLRREWPDLRDALSAAASIASGLDGWERELSARLFGDPKRLSALRARVAQVLRDADSRWASTPASPADVLAGYGVRIGAPEIVELTRRRRGLWNVGYRLGNGGQGDVYAAWRDGEVEDKYVLKEMKRSQPRPDRPAENAALRFATEVGALKALGEAGINGIVKVIEFNLAPDDGMPPWFVMPRYRYCLHEHRRKYRKNVDRTLALIAAIADTLAALHSANQAHRDVKVRNIFFDDLAGLPVLGDFGLVWRSDSETSITEVGDTLGPAAWRPPEFRSGGVRVDQRSADIYLLGGMLYELISGRRFEESEHRGSFTHERPEYNLLREMDDSRVSYINELLRGMLARDPEHRATAEEVASRIRALSVRTPSALRTS